MKPSLIKLRSTTFQITSVLRCFIYMKKRCHLFCRGFNNIFKIFDVAYVTCFRNNVT